MSSPDANPTVDVQTKDAASHDEKESVGAYDRHEGPLTEANKAKTRRILMKLDVRVLPVATVLYFFSFLDRAAIGNAKVAGMNADLGLTGPQYVLSVCLFFVTYALFGEPRDAFENLVCHD